MTKENKQLLLIDLSARFPYNVAIKCSDEDSRFTCYLTSDILREIQNNTCHYDYKSYLFPLSSMTEEQKSQYSFFLTRIIDGYDSSLLIDWLNKNHFDFRNLIPMGLAIDATNLNIY